MSTMPTIPATFPPRPTTQPAIRDVLIDALISEYGFDRDHWADFGSANRVARVVEAAVVARCRMDVAS